MKNLKSFPFERNRYFYGKLLSVDDFETEQKYFNDKRRTINRFLFGSGVVCGLNVVEVDDESISIERGLALDFAGREIVIDEPVVKRVAELEGYDDGQSKEQDCRYYYLCLEYQEEGAELMHNVAGTTDKNSGEYNKYKEGYRLFVTQMEPEQQIFTPASLYEESRTVYCEQGVKISQILPRYIEMGADTTLRIEIENTGQQQEFSFEYELVLSFLTCRDETTIRIYFDEKEHAKDKKYILEIPLKAAYVNGVTAEASLSLGSFIFRAGDREYSTASHCVSQASLSARDSYQIVQEAYYKGAMDYIVSHTFQQSIYLAKIYVVKAGETCMIERIEPLPFQQSILHTEISTALIHKLSSDVKKLKTACAMTGEVKKDAGKKEEMFPRIASGEVEFDLEAARPGQTLYSEEISHGLGFAYVAIVLGYEIENDLSDGGGAVFGAPGIFNGHEDSPEISLGARLNVSEGSFVIGMKSQKNHGAGKVKVHWTALRDVTCKSVGQKKKHIFIQPDIPNLYTGESMVFTAILEGFQDERLKWRVKDQDGGTIDKTGKYTAPETPGVYQISVKSTAYPDVRATTFVVVQEKKEE